MALCWRWATWIALCLCATTGSAQDISLTSRNGALTLSGSLQGYDGEFYTIKTSYGTLTVDAQGVLCAGPGCPDLTTPRAQIRIVGDADAGSRLILPLFKAFAADRGYRFVRTDGTLASAEIQSPGNGKTLAVISFAPLETDQARALLGEGEADLVITSRADPGFHSRVVAMDALVPIVAPDNPITSLSTSDLARALTGKMSNWAEAGGPDRPIVLHAVGPGRDIGANIAELLGQSVIAAVWHADQSELAKAVARDPWALAVTGHAAVGPARILPLTDSCGQLLPTEVKAIGFADNPLTYPILLLVPPRRLPLVAREFLEFLSSSVGNDVASSLGFMSRTVERFPLSGDGTRLINAIRSAGDDVTLPDLQALAQAMQTSDRLSLTFRFTQGGTELDAASRQNLEDLADLIGAGTYRQERLKLVGFSDGTGPAAENLALSLERAKGVSVQLQALLPDLAPDVLPDVAGFGEALPTGCDATDIGKNLNRRVEVWVSAKSTDPVGP